MTAAQQTAPLLTAMQTAPDDQYRKEIELQRWHGSNQDHPDADANVDWWNKYVVYLNIVGRHLVDGCGDLL